MRSIRRSWRYVLQLLLLTATQGALAQEPQVKEGSPEEVQPKSEVVLDEIVVKSRAATRVDTLEVREVRETAARDLGEALQQQGNLTKVRKAGIANDIVLRGMKKDDINVLIDGAQVHGACPSRMDPPSSHLDYAEVDRVEVKKGPFDVGNPGGLGGIVDVRTRAARPGFASEVNFGYASSQASETSAVVSYAGRRSDLMVGGAFKYSQPYTSADGRNFTQAVPETSTARYRNTSPSQTAYDIRSGWAKAGFAPTEGQRMELSYTRQAAKDVLYPYLLMDGITDDTDRLNATYRVGAAGPLSKGLAQLYWTRVVHDMDDRDRCSSSAAVGTCERALPRVYSMRTLARSTTWGGKLEGGGPSTAFDLLGGADFYVRNWDNVTTRVQRLPSGPSYADEASVPDVTMTNVGFYAEAQRDLLEGVRATVGARVDVTTSKANVDRTDQYAIFHPGTDLALSRTDVLPSGNLQVDWAVLPEVSLFAGYGHGTRAPDQQERYFALSGSGPTAALPRGRPWWVGNPALEPVRNDEVDLGAKWAVGSALVKAQVFHAWLGDYVTLANATATSATDQLLTAKTYRNVNARMWGGEASARVRLPARLSAAAAVAYTRGVNETFNTDLAEIPPLKASASLRWDIGYFFAEAEEQYAARQDRVDTTLLEEPTPAWYITNVRLGMEWKGLKAFAGVRNLFDKQYVEHLSYLRDPFAAGVKVFEPGRVVYSNVQYAF